MDVSQKRRGIFWEVVRLCSSISALISQSLLIIPRKVAMPRKKRPLVTKTTSEQEATIGLGVRNDLQYSGYSKSG